MCVLGMLSNAMPGCCVWMIVGAQDEYGTFMSPLSSAVQSCIHIAETSV